MYDVAFFPVNSIWPDLQWKLGHHSLQCPVVQYFAKRNTLPCLFAVNCCLRLKLVLTFCLYVTWPENILLVDFRVYQLEQSGSKARTSLNDVMSQRNFLCCLKLSFCPIFNFSSLFVQHYASSSLMWTYVLLNIYIIFKRDRLPLPNAMRSKICIIAFLKSNKQSSKQSNAE